MSGTSTLIDADIFAELVGSNGQAFEPETARAILGLKFSESQNERMRELADRNNRGALSDEERELMESFRRVGNLLALLQSQARLALHRLGALQ